MTHRESEWIGVALIAAPWVLGLALWLALS